MLSRYRRLSVWNKLAVWGSIASILGLVSALVAFSLSPEATIQQQTSGDASPAINGVDGHVLIINEQNSN